MQILHLKLVLQLFFLIFCCCASHHQFMNNLLTWALLEWCSIELYSCFDISFCRMFWVGCVYGKNDESRFGFFCHSALEFLLQKGSSPVSTWYVPENFIYRIEVYYSFSGAYALVFSHWCIMIVYCWSNFPQFLLAKLFRTEALF